MVESRTMVYTYVKILILLICGGLVEDLSNLIHSLNIQRNLLIVYTLITFLDITKPILLLGRKLIQYIIMILFLYWRRRKILTHPLRQSARFAINTLVLTIKCINALLLSIKMHQYVIF